MNKGKGERFFYLARFYSNFIKFKKFLLKLSKSCYFQNFNFKSLFDAGLSLPFSGLSPNGKKIYLTTKLEIAKINNERSKTSTDLGRGSKIANLFSTSPPIKRKN